MSQESRRSDAGAPEHIEGLIDAMQQRVASVDEIVRRTLRLEERNVLNAVDTFNRWMMSSTIVRVIAAGRTRLALAIAANRLAHGGARVSILDDTVPMPNTSKGGAILTASASGANAAILRILREAKHKEPSLTVLGVGGRPTTLFRSYCDIFIELHDDTDQRNEGLPTLRVLSDWREQSICILVDAMVAAAGRLGGLDERAWRLGHEDLGATGPYDQHSLAKEDPGE